MDVVIRYLDWNECLDKLEEIGVSVNREATKIEDVIGVANTPNPQDVVTLDYSLAIRLDDEQFELLPTAIEKPIFVVDWREDWADELTGEQFPWPKFAKHTYDIDGNVTGTMLQEVGRVA